MQLIGFSFIMVWRGSHQWIHTDDLFSGSHKLEAILHEVRSVGGIFFDDPWSSEWLLSLGEVALGGLDIIIELRGKVVIDILSLVMVSSLGLLSAHNPLLSVHKLGVNDRFLGIKDVVVHSKVGNEIIKVVSERSLFCFVLSATGWGTDWVGFNTKLNIFLIREVPLTKFALSIF